MELRFSQIEEKQDLKMHIKRLDGILKEKYRMYKRATCFCCNAHEHSHTVTHTRNKPEHKQAFHYSIPSPVCRLQLLHNTPAYSKPPCMLCDFRLVADYTFLSSLFAPLLWRASIRRGRNKWCWKQIAFKSDSCLMSTPFNGLCAPVLFTCLPCTRKI